MILDSKILELMHLLLTNRQDQELKLTRWNNTWYVTYQVGKHGYSVGNESLIEALSYTERWVEAEEQEEPKCTN
jgi:hypothetical protein